MTSFVWAFRRGDFLAAFFLFLVTIFVSFRTGNADVSTSSPFPTYQQAATCNNPEQAQLGHIGFPRWFGPFRSCWVFSRISGAIPKSRGEPLRIAYLGSALSTFQPGRDIVAEAGLPIALFERAKEALEWLGVGHQPDT